MPIWLTKLQPSPWLLRKLLMLAILAGVGVGSFFYGRWQQANAAKDTPMGLDGPGPLEPEYYKRVVAYIYDKPIYRAELGEYLIQRFGAERLDYMVNRRIVEVECAKFNITVSDGEVEARFQEDLKSFGMHITEREFVNSILRRFGKTLFEWKEDVIRPKIMMEKLVDATVTITQNDLQEGFEARYGPKVECRMIVVAAGNAGVAQKVWDTARKGRDAFLIEASKQFIPNLAGAAGAVPPIHKHFGDKKLEDAAFRLKEGEISPLLSMIDGTYVILLCEKHLPANVSVHFEDEVAKLSKEMQALRVSQRIPVAFEELRKKASPQLVLNNKGSAVPPPVNLPSDQSPVLSRPPVDVPPPPVVRDVKLPETPPPKVDTSVVPKIEMPPPTPKDAAKDKSPMSKDAAPMPPLSLAPTLPIAPTPGSVVPSLTPPLLVPPPVTPKKKD